MDKNTIIGLVLIGVLLVGFSILSRPSQEQLEAQQHYYDSIAQVQQREAELKAKQEAALENERIARRDSSALFHQALHGTDQEVTIENNVASLTLHTKGGVLYQSVLKEYKEQDKQTPLTLVRGGDAEMNFLFYNRDEIIETKDYYFTPVQQTDSSITMRLQADSASYIDFCYTMHPDNYLVDFTIQRRTGMEGKLASTNRHVDIEWSERARQIEKGYTYENRLAELTYKRDGEGSDYLNANQDDQEDIAETLNWVAFKNQFFSAVMLSEAGFQKASLASRTGAERQRLHQGLQRLDEHRFRPHRRGAYPPLPLPRPQPLQDADRPGQGPRQGLGAEPPGLPGLAALPLDQQMDHNQPLRLAAGLGPEHGRGAAVPDHHRQGGRLPRHVEDLPVLRQDARAEAED